MTSLLAADAIPGGRPINRDVDTSGLLALSRSTGNLLLPGERLPTISELQVMAELAHHGSFKDAAWCLGKSHNTTKNLAYRMYPTIEATTSIEALRILGWLVPPRVLLGCDE